MSLNTSIIPGIQLGVNYSPGDMVVGVSGKILIKNSQNDWTHLSDWGGRTSFIDADDSVYYILPRKINEVYTVGVKQPA